MSMDLFFSQEVRCFFFLSFWDPELKNFLLYKLFINIKILMQKLMFQDTESIQIEGRM